MIVASIATATATPTPRFLTKMICDVAKAPIATTSSSAAAVTIGRCVDAERDCLLAARAGVACLLDARGRTDECRCSGERDREQHEAAG